jgi:hypothetical protein
MVLQALKIKLARLRQDTQHQDEQARVPWDNPEARDASGRRSALAVDDVPAWPLWHWPVTRRHP